MDKLSNIPDSDADLRERRRAAMEMIGYGQRLTYEELPEDAPLRRVVDGIIARDDLEAGK